MQRPDLHIVKPAPDVDADPPREVVSAEDQVAEPDGEVSKPITNTFLSFLRSSLAVLSVLAIITLIFLSVLSAIFIAVDPPAPRSETAAIEPSPEEVAQTDEPLSFHSFSEDDLAPVTTVRSNVRRKRTRPRAYVKGYRLRRPPRRRPAPLVPLFVPTTLVIYIEDGVIKTRTEPWLQNAPPAKKRQ